MKFDQDYIEAGKISEKAREYGKKLIKEGAKARDVANAVEAKIIELGGKPSFPVDISINGMAAHACPGPEDETIFQKGDLVKLDMGAHVNGKVTDTAVTVEVSTNNWEKLIEASAKALENAEKLLKPGVKINEIGKVISETIKSYGYKPIINLNGHGIGEYEVHTKPTIPNYDNGDTTELKEGQTIAIEPFATVGVGLVKEGKPSGIYEILNLRPTRSQAARKVLEFIQKNYQTLPFCTRWLSKIPGYKFALRTLEQEKIIYQFAELPEKSNGITSQAEHSFMIGHGRLT
ncbi:MAG: type II methionyl aminopeptidase [Candidatus Nanoarchaeia archaeon]|nr:type II methionyl aminopeptidase [Candidatus Nanoarchaeia archaeon]